MRVACVLAIAGTALLAACGNATSPAVGSAVTSGGPLPADVFVAQYEYGSGDTGGGHGTFLSLFDERSGAHVRDLVHVEERSAVHLAGHSRNADGSVTYALARGPQCTGNGANCAPRPGSCGGTVYRLDARTGGTRPLFSVGKDSTVGWPSASPDGTSVAYLSQPCTATFAQQVVVRELSSGRERHIFVPQASTVRVAWRGDGAQLVFTVMYPQQRTGANVPSYVVVPANADGPQPVSAVHRAPDPGCMVEAAVFASPGIQLVEGCPDVVTAPARLVQLVDAGPGVRWREDTGLCPNGMTLAHDPSDRLLVTSTTTCGAAGTPVEVVQSWTGQQSRELGRYVNPQQFLEAAT
jgi:hypothetical protein